MIDIQLSPQMIKWAIENPNIYLETEMEDLLEIQTKYKSLKQKVNELLKIWNNKNIDNDHLVHEIKDKMEEIKEMVK